MIEFKEEVERAASYVARDWPGVIEADDIVQEIWIRLMESPKAQESLREAESALRFDVLKRWGKQVASQYSNSYELFSGNSYYGTDRVRSLLKSGLLTAARWDLGEMNETLTEFLDLHEGFDHLKRTSDYGQVIWDEYVEGDYSKEKPSERMKLSRAVTALTDAMNQTHKRRFAEHAEGPGTRKVVSNEKARLISKSDLNEDNKVNAFAQ
ncbi:hypothetical protein LZ318_11750 [Saccharopolyspora indica]|uniref:hypothetical protein n=1 Tax=Saccharopolyspora indica TaxID=1229659 RepID=UPI0022EA67D0|nr:hypothetical protein [Saccharopolyspora indica]MDA3643815.1 hypothetical protein [Saccharopolyspora indica]